MKETAVCRQEKANCISSDILADMLDGTDFSVWSGRDPKKYVWEATLKCKYARLIRIDPCCYRPAGVRERRIEVQFPSMRDPL